MKLPREVTRAMNDLERELDDLDFSLPSARDLIAELRRFEREEPPGPTHPFVEAFEKALGKAASGDEKLYRAWREGTWVAGDEKDPKL